MRAVCEVAAMRAKRSEKQQIGHNHIFYTCLILVLAIAAFGLLVRY
jgi:hypothetical protein